MENEIFFMYPPEIKPKQNGVYIASADPASVDGSNTGITAFARFENGLWGVGYLSAEEAATLPMECFFADQSKYWRWAAN